MVVAWEVKRLMGGGNKLESIPLTALGSLLLVCVGVSTGTTRHLYQTKLFV